MKIAYPISDKFHKNIRENNDRLGFIQITIKEQKIAKVTEDQNKNLNNIISLNEASLKTGYHQDYLGFLCRSGKLKGFKIGRNWVTTQEALNEFLSSQTGSQGPLSVNSPEQTITPEEAVKEKVPVRVFQPGVSLSELNSNAFELQAQTIKPKLESLKTQVLDSIEQRVLDIKQNVETLEKSVSEKADLVAQAQVANAIISDKAKSNKIAFNDSNLKHKFSPSISLQQEHSDQLVETNKQSNNLLGTVGLAALYESFKTGQSSFSKLGNWIFGTVSVAALAALVFVLLNFSSVPKVTETKIVFQNTPSQEVPKVFENTQTQTGTSTPAQIIQTTKTIIVRTQTEQTQTKLLGMDKTTLYSLIDDRLNQYLAEGKFKGPVGETGAQGPIGASGVATTLQGGWSLGYTAPNPSTSGTGSIGAVTHFSSQDFTTGTLTVNNISTFNGNSTFNNLTVNGSTTLNGSTTIASLSVSNLNPGLTQGSVAFQGALGLSQDNANFFYNSSTSQLSLGTNSATSSAAFQIDSTSKGFLAPRMSGAQRDAIALPAYGLLVYNTDTNLYNFYNGTTWTAMNSGGGGGSGGVDAGVTGAIAYYQTTSATVSPQTTLFFNNNKIGIGTNSPLTRLSVQNLATTTSDTFDVASSSGASFLRVTALGNVGVGTSNPLTTLDVNGTIRTTGFLTPSAGAGLELNYNPSNGNAAIYAVDRGSASYKNLNLNDKAFITSGGNFGIGTTTPLEMLAVQGGNILLSPQYTLRSLTSTGGNTALIGLDPSDYTSVYSPGNGVKIKNAASGDLVTITNAGLVGIGTTTPQYALDVNGTGNIYNASSAGDTVFNIQASSAQSGKILKVVSSDAASTYFDVGTTGTRIGNTLSEMSSTSWAILNSGLFETKNSGSFRFSGTASAIAAADLSLFRNAPGVLHISAGINTTTYASVIAGKLALNTTTLTSTLFVQGTSTLPTLPLLTVASSSGTTFFEVTQAGNVNVATLTASSLVMSDAGKNLQSVTLGTGLSLSSGTLSVTSAPNANAAWTIGSGLIYNATSTDLVGIGTTAPSTTLFVQGKGGTNPFAVASSTGEQLLTVSSAGITTINQLTVNGVTTLSAATTTINGATYYWPNSVPVGNKVLQSDSSGNLSWVTDQTGAGGTVSGGLAGYVTTWSSSTQITYGRLIDNGTVAGMNATSSTISFNIQGTAGNIDPFNVASSSGTSYLRVTKDGNVGIGTTTPNSALVVQSGTSYLTYTNPSGSIAQLNGTGDFKVRASGGNLQLDSSGSIVNVVPTLDATNYTTAALTVAGGVGISKTLLVSGNVGIGTITPTSTLFVQSAAGVNPLTIVSSTGTSIMSLNSSGALTVQPGISGQAANFQTTAVNGNTQLNVTSYGGQTQVVVGANYNSAGYIGTTNSYPFDFLINNSTKMRLDTSGNLGIGTTSPTSTLFVQGTGAVNPFIIASSTGSALLTVSPTGNVGIGTATPVSRLSVQGLAGANDILDVASSTGTSVFRVTAAGKVGIGTSNPGNSLDIYGPPGQLGIYNTSNSNAQTFGFSTNSNAARLFMNDASSVTQINLIAGQNSYINGSAGNLGIGTTTPSSTLQVAGDIQLGSKANASSAALIFNTGSTTNQTTIRLLATTSLASSYTLTLPTTTPSAGQSILSDVNGNLFWGNGTGSITGSGTNGYVTRWLTSTTQGTGVLLDNGTVAGVNATSSSYTFNIQGSSGKSPLQISSSTGTSLVVVDQGGNVGIGITTPVMKFAVYGNAAIGSGALNNYVTSPIHHVNVDNLQIGNGLSLNSNNNVLQSDVSNNYFYSGTVGATYLTTGFAQQMQYDNNGNINFYTAPSGTSGNAMTLTNRLSILNSGNVGIGTTSPDKLLTIYGSQDTSLATTGLQPGSAAGTVGINLINNNGGALPSRETSLSFSAGNGATYGSLTRYAAISGVSTGSGSGGSIGDLLFSTKGSVAATTTTEVMRVTSGGNVGIGTTSPTANLMIGNVTTVSTASPIVQSLGGTYSNTAGVNPKLKIWEDGTSFTGLGQSLNSLDFMVFNGAAFNFYQGGSKKVTIDTNGNVGIGTTSPNKLLNVYSSSASVVGLFESTAAAAQVSLDLKSANSYYRLIAQPSANNGRFDIYDQNAGGYRLSIDSSGNIGIGTTSPAQKLVVVGTGGNNDILDIASSTGTSVVRVTAAGNVGIGNSAPATALQITRSNAADTELRVENSDTGAFNNTLSLYRDGTVNASLSLGRSSGALTLANNYSAGPIYLKTGGASQLALISTGNIGINTTTPNARLSVVNAATTTGIAFDVASSSGSSLFQINALGAELHNGSAGSTGNVLMSNGSSATPTWVSTSTLFGASMLTGSGTNGYVTRWSASNVLTSGVLLDNGTVGGINATSSTVNFLVQGTGANNAFQINSSTGTSLLTVTPAGSVGIGTTTPGAPLYVFGNKLLNGNYVTLAVDGGGSPNGNETGIQFDVLGAKKWYLVNRSDAIADRFAFRNAADSELLTILQTGNVGIGTTTPAAKLQVSGSASELLRLASGAGAYPYVSFYGNDSAVRSGYIQAAATSLDIGSETGSSNTITFATSGSEKVRITSGGNVGIGTTSPENTLQVQGNQSIISTTNPFLRIASASTASSTRAEFILTYNTAGDYGSIDMYHQGVGAKALVLQPQGGNVGIGTTTPSHALVISSDLGERIQGSSLGRLVLGVGAQNWYIDNFGTTGAPNNRFRIAEDSGERFSILSGGNVGIGTSTPGAKLQVANGAAAGSLIPTTSGLLVSGSSSGNRIIAADGNKVTYFNTYTTGPTYGELSTYDYGASAGMNLVLNSNGGNIGIGTTTPGDLVTIAGSNPRLDIFDGNGSGNARVAITAYGGASANAALQTRTNIPLYLGANSGQQITIATTNNVGIGTTSPQQALHVYKAGSNSYVEVDGNAANNVGYRIHQDNTTKWLMYVPGSTSDMRFNDGSDRITFQSGGNVGIGTTSPLAKLHVYGTNADMIIDGTNSENLYFYNNGVQKWNLTALNSSQDFALYNNGGTNSYNLVVQRSSGNVGIGTTSPLGNLHIYANSNPRLIVDRANNTGGALQQFFTAGVGDWSLGVPSTASDFAIQNNTGASVVSLISSGSVANTLVLKAGNVGIGTTTPGQTLTVVGSARITGSLYDSANSAGTYGMVLLSTSTGTTWVATSTLGIISNGVSGGTNGYVARFISASGLSTGILLDNGTRAGVNATSSSYTFNLQGSSGVNPFQVASSTGTSLFVINNNGYVGIGTTTPAATLDVYSNVSGVIPTIRVQSGPSASFPAFQLSDTRTNGHNWNIETGRQLGNLDFYNGTGFGQVMTLTTTGNVGIGTITPQALLHVAKNSSYANNLTDALIIGNSSSPTKRIQAGYDSTIDAGYLQSIDYGNAYKSLSLNPNGGNVGIGTTTPLNQLQVGSLAGIDGNLGVSDFSSNLYYSGGWKYKTAAPGSILEQYNGDVYVMTTPTGSVGGSATMTERFRVTQGGNVGIGTSTPTSVSGFGPVVEISGANPALVLADTTDSRRWLLGGNSAGQLNLKIDGGSDIMTILTNGVGVGGTPGSAFSVNGGVSLGTYYSSPAPTNGLIVSGNVGIGTITPTSTLFVQGTTTNAILTVASSTGTNLFQITSLGNVNVATLTASSLVMADSGKNLSSVTLGSGLALTSGTLSVTGSPNANAAWTIGSGLIYNATSTDLVGIGTITPTTTLFVQGKAGTNPFAVATSSGAQVLTVTQNGNVGVGISSPYTKLQVVGTGMFGTQTVPTNFTTGNDVVYFENATGSPYTQFHMYNTDDGNSTTIESLLSMNAQGSTAFWSAGDTSPGLQLWTRTNHPLRFATNNTEVMRITAGGNVGINTTSPVATLAVKGAGAAPTLYIASSSGSSQLIVTAAGNVGIGTPNPTNKLEVVGGNIMVNNDGGGGVFVAGNIAYGMQYVGGVGLQILGSGGGGAGISLTPDSAGTVNVTTGNFAVGTTTPSSKAQIVGNLELGSKAVASAANLIFNTGSTTNQTTVRILATTSLASSYTLTLPTTTPSSGQVITSDSNGNLYWTTSGVGSVSGSGTIGFDAIWSGSSALTTGKLINNGTVLGVNASSSSITFNLQGNSGGNDILNIASSSGTSILTVKANSRLGFNSSTPTSLFVVQGTNLDGNTTTPIFTVASSTGSSYFTVLANGNVGIGTSGPAQLLSIYATSSFPGIRVEGGTTANGVNGLEMRNANGNQWNVGVYGNAIGTTWGPDAFFIQNGSTKRFLIDNTGLMHLSSLQMFLWHSGSDSAANTVDVGLARNNAGVLEIDGGTPGSYRDLQLRSFNPDGTKLGVNSTSPISQLSITGSGSNNILSVAASTGVIALQVNSGGNVGIGTTTAIAALQVTGPSINNNSANTSTTRGLYVSPNPTAAANTLLATDYRGFETSGYTLQLSSTTAVSQIYGSLHNQITVNTTTVATIAGASTAYINGAPKSTSNLTISSSTALTVAGGTVSSTTNAIALYVTAPTGATNNYAALFMGGSVGINTSSPSGIFTVASSTNPNTTLLTVLGNGNVGIGVSSPGVTLDVNGPIRNTLSTGLTIGDVSGLNRLIWNNDHFNFITGNGYAPLGVSSLSVGTVYGGTAAPAEGIVVQGNVGIGTATPSSTLQVAGDIQLGSKANASSSAIIFNTGSTTNQTTIRLLATTSLASSYTLTLPTSTPSAGNAILTDANGNLYFGTAGTALSGGTNGYLSRWTSASTLSSGISIDNGTVAGINATSSTVTFNLQGNAGSNDIFNISSSSGVSVLRVTNNQRVGIGSTTPNATLVVQGTSTSPTLDLFRLASSSNATVFSVDSQGLITSNVQTSANMLSIIGPSIARPAGISFYESSISVELGRLQAGDNGNKYLAFWNSLDTPSLLANWTTGNVGIGGTTSPIATLSVLGQAGNNPILELASSTGASMLRVTAAGNVGIGTTTPVALLHVAGAFRASNSTGAAYFDYDGGTSPIVTVNALVGGSNTINYNIAGQALAQFSISSGTFTFKNFKSPSLATVYTILQNAGVTNGSFGLGSTTPSATMVVQGQAGNTQDILRIATSTNDVYFNVTSAGNVGIGTSNPTAKLNIVGTSGDVFQNISTLDQNNSYIQLSNNTAGIIMGMEDNTGAGMLAGSPGIAYSGFITTSNAGAALHLGNAYKAQLTIATNGAVGIATLTPSSMLQVVGNIELGSKASTTSSSLIFNTGSTTNQTTVRILATTSLASSYTLTLPTTTPSAGNAILTDANGNLYFGTAGSALSGGTNGYLSRWTSASALSSGISIDNGTVAGINATSSTVTFNLQGNVGSGDIFNISSSTGTSFLRVTAEGNVGVGTTTPGAKLEVYGGNLKINNVGNNSQAQFYNGGTFLGSVAALGLSGDVQLFASKDGATPAISLSSGNTGIGTTSPAALLHISKDASTSGQAWNNLQVRISGATNPLGHLNLGYDTTGSFGEIQAGQDGGGWKNLVLNWNGGNVGIATSAPIAKLSVVGTSGANDILEIASSSGASVLRVTASGNVGIGTATPAKLLHLSANYSGGELLRLDRTANASAPDTFGFGVTFDGLGSDSSYWNVTTGGANTINTGVFLSKIGNFGVGTMTPVSKLTVAGNGGDVIDVGSSSGASYLRVTAGGNVGIGTTTPQANLSVVGTVNVYEGDVTLNNNASYLWRNTLGGTTGLKLDSSNYITTLTGSNYPAGISLLVGPSNVGLTVVGGIGNVGIGTSTPDQTLVVSGSARVLGALYDSNNSAGTYGMVLLSTSTGTTWVATSTLGITGGSGVSGGTNGYVARFTSATALSTGLLIDNGTVAGVNATSSSYTFNLQGSSGKAPLQISSSTGTSMLVVDQNGNLGIAASAITDKITIGTNYGVNIFRQAIRINNDGFDVPAAPGADSYGDKLVVWNDAGNKMALGMNISKLWMQSTGSIGFYTSSTIERLTINSSGNVGIGSTSPNATLVVQGTSTLPTLDILRIASSTGVSAFTVTAGGNLGVGTNTPTSKLVIQNSAGLGNILDIASSSGSSLMTMDALGNINMQGMGTITWDGNNGYGARTTIGPSNITLGNNGGGFVNTLQIYNNVPASNNLSVTFLSNQYGTAIGTTTTANAQLTIQGWAGSGYNQDLFRIASGTTGTVFLDVTSSGNVGLGTTTPTAMLALQGTANSADLFKISSSTGANMIYVSKFGGFVQDISSTTAFTIKDGSGNQVFNIDTTQSSNNAGLDITAGGSQTGNLLNFYSSGGSVMLAVTSVGGLVQNISSTTAFQLQNGSATPIFNVDTVNGKVGIGTTTGMSALDIISNISINETGNPSTGSSTATGLRVITSDDDSPSVLIKNSSPIPCVGQSSGCSSAVAAGSPGILTIESSTSSNTSWYNLITAYSGTARNSGAAVFRVRGDGNVYGEAAFNASGADYAEYFDTFDTGIEPGDLVIATTTDANLMTAALTDAGLSSSSTSTIISGLATSTLASMSTSSVNTLSSTSTLVSAIMKSQRAYDNKILGIVSSQAAFIGNNPGGRSDSNKFKKAVGLVGRVPVKVTNENGEIHVGDFITSSGQFNGYGMKASRSGYVLGVALEDFKPFASSTITSGATGGSVLVFIKPGYQNVNNTFVLGENDGQITSATSTLSNVKSDAFIIDQKGSGNILQLQVNGADKFVIDNSGSAILYGDALSNTPALSVVTASTTMFSVSVNGDVMAKGKITVGKDTAGTAIIKTGDNKVTVTFTTSYPTVPKVLVTVQGLPNFFYGVTEKTATGFTITTSAPVPADFSFDWVALNQPEDNGSGQSGQGSISVQSSPISPISQGGSDGGNSSPTPTPTPDAGTVAGTSTPPSADPTPSPTPTADPTPSPLPTPTDIPPVTVVDPGPPTP